MLNLRTSGRLGRRRVFAAAGVLLAAPSIVRAQGRNGAALVIGNSKYQWEASLPNVKRDAPDMAKHFEALGLKTQLVEDADRNTMVAAVETFKASLHGADLGAIYFAGHGAQWVKDSYVVPIDADLSTPNATGQLVSISSINQGMSGARHRLMVFDNCRNNPADGWAQLATQRVAVINPDVQLQTAPPPNTLVLFSTAPGRVALDGPPGQNSPFCAVLMRELEAPSIDFQGLPAQLRRDLLVVTEGRQVLWDTSTYNAPYQVPGTRGLKETVARSSWGDPSRVVELGNAYAFAQQAGLLLPQGLIAHRPASNSRDAIKVGSYKFNAQTPFGRLDQILIVVSVDEGHTAECILASKSATANTPLWRFVTAEIKGANLEYTPRDGAAHFTFAWNGANGGSLNERREGFGGGSNRVGGPNKGVHGGAGGGGSGGPLTGGGLTVPFTRLDG
jgi:hypothetical protein